MYIRLLVGCKNVLIDSVKGSNVFNTQSVTQVVINTALTYFFHFKTMNVVVTA